MTSSASGLRRRNPFAKVLRLFLPDNREGRRGGQLAVGFEVRMGDGACVEDMDRIFDGMRVFGGGVEGF